MGKANKDKAEMENLKKELKFKFNEDMKNKLEIEKSKYQLELDKAINKDQLLKIQYDNLKEKYDKDILNEKQNLYGGHL